MAPPVLLYSQTIPQPQRLFQIPLTFTQSRLLLVCTPTNNIASWDVTAKVQPLIEVEGVWRPAIKKFYRVTRNGIYYSDYNSYRLLFYIAPPVAGLDVQIFSVNPSDVTTETNTTITTTSANVSVSQFGFRLTSGQVLAANANRTGGVIINNTSTLRDLWIRPGTAAAVANAPSAFVPRSGGTLVFPPGYTGAIQGIWAGASTTANASVYEFLP